MSNWGQFGTSERLGGRAVLLWCRSSCSERCPPYRYFKSPFPTGGAHTRPPRRGATPSAMLHIVNLGVPRNSYEFWPFNSQSRPCAPSRPPHILHNFLSFSTQFTMLHRLAGIKYTVCACRRAGTRKCHFSALPGTLAHFAVVISLCTLNQCFSA